jgi:MFS family permease
MVVARRLAARRARERRSVILAPFRVRGFLFQWPADLLTNCAIEMEVLMLGWFILTETQSVLLLTVFAALRYLGTPIAPLFGMAGDRFGHRRLLCAMRASYAATAAIMTVLTFAGLLGPIPIFVAAVFAGVVKPSDLVMRNALIAAIMPPEQLMTAMGAAGTTSDISRILGPLAGAAFVAAMGLGPAFLVIAVGYAVASVLTAMGGQGLAHRRAAGVGQASFVREVGDGLRYVWRTPCLHAGMWLAVLVNATVIPLTGGLMPYIARDVYHLDRFGLGCLLACFSAGAFCGSVGVGILGSRLPAARTFIVAVLVWCTMVQIYIFMPNPVGAGVFLVLAGIAQNFCQIPLFAMLLRVAGEQYRGRVMGVRMMAVYGLPMGLLAAGWLIERIGFTAMAVGYCVGGFVLTLAIAFRWRAALWPMTAVANARR